MILESSALPAALQQGGSQPACWFMCSRGHRDVSQTFGNTPPWNFRGRVPALLRRTQHAGWRSSSTYCVSRVCMLGLASWSFTGGPETGINSSRAVRFARVELHQRVPSRQVGQQKCHGHAHGLGGFGRSAIHHRSAMRSAIGDPQGGNVIGDTSVVGFSIFLPRGRVALVSCIFVN